MLDHQSNESIKILHLISGDLWAGAEVQVFHTLMHLKQFSKYSFSAILFNDGILNQKLKQNNIETILVREDSYNAIIMIRIIKRIIHDLKPKIIHVHCYKGHIIGYLSVFLNRTPLAIVRTMHGLTKISNGALDFQQLKSSIIHGIEHFILNRQNVNIIAVSKDLETILKKAYPKASVTQIYNAIPPVKKLLPSKTSIREKYNIRNETFWIGAVARLVKVKNISLLIDAALLLVKESIDFKISIWGEGPLKNSLQNKINYYQLEEFVKLEGFEEKIHPIIRSLNVFILPSFHEGMPMSLLESMSLGIPVICTSVGGMKEIIRNKYSGLLVPSNDKNFIARAILLLYRNKSLRVKLADNAKKNIEKNFNMKNNLRKLTNLYNCILIN